MNILDDFKLYYEEIGSPTGYLMEKFRARIKRK